MSAEPTSEEIIDLAVELDIGYEDAKELIELYEEFESASEDEE